MSDRPMTKKKYQTELTPEQIEQERIARQMYKGSPYNFYVKAGVYIYLRRSCTTCEARTECKAMKGKDWSVKWLDLGRCGCCWYRGQYADEPRLMLKRGKRVSL